MKVDKLVLQRALAGRSVLLVLDDVWDQNHASELDVVGGDGRLLVTTRNREILVGLGAGEVQLEFLTPEESRMLLARWVGMPVAELPEIADRVAEECGHLPLALAMIGAMVRLETEWSDVLERLQRADLDKIRQQFPEYPYPDLLRALAVSVEALAPEERGRYLELAVFPEDMSIPAVAIEILWSRADLDGIESRALIGRLVARSLARRAEKGSIRLHDLQRDYIRRQVGNVAKLQGEFVSFNGINGATGGPLCPFDDYRQLMELVIGRLSDSPRKRLSRSIRPSVVLR